MQKSLDQKVANIRGNPGGAKDFILADAKDADMAAGLAAPGKDAGTGEMRSLGDYRGQMRAGVQPGLGGILLLASSTSGLLPIRERALCNSHATPAVPA